jgi:hypothetical protein
MSNQVSNEINYSISTYDKFNVYTLQDKYSFFYIDIADTQTFYEEMFDYFFSEEKLLNYIENKTSLKYSPTFENYISFYQHMELYIDSENLEMEISIFKDEIKEILKEEYELIVNTIGNLTIRQDKIGRMGEYIFYLVLANYFKFDCIIPKVQLTTDHNMSVYGIDSVFYSSQKDLLLFGESKLTKNIDNGIKLINSSLKEYERQITDEYTLVFSNRLIKKILNNKFLERYGNMIEASIDLKDFINKANIKIIGIPIFIAHGHDNDVSLIFSKLNNIKKKKYFGLTTYYYIIFVPIVNKNKLCITWTKKVREKREWYEKQYRKSPEP